jgi:hypothetical protein
MVYAFALVAFAIAVVLVVLAVGLLAKLIRAIAVATVIVAAALGVGLSTAVIVSLLTTGSAEFSGLGSASGIIAFIVAIPTIVSWRRSQRTVSVKHSTTIKLEPAIPVELDNVDEVKNVAPSKKRGKPIDTTISKAFTLLKAGAIGRDARLESIEERYQAFLAMADRFPEDSEANTIARKIRPGVSDYIEMFRRETELATDPERHASRAALINTLETIATEAERHRARLQSESDNRLKMQAEFLTHGIEPKPFSTLD